MNESPELSYGMNSQNKTAIITLALTFGWVMCTTELPQNIAGSFKELQSMAHELTDIKNTEAADALDRKLNELIAELSADSEYGTYALGAKEKLQLIRAEAQRASGLTAPKRLSDSDKKLITEFKRTCGRIITKIAEFTTSRSGKVPEVLSPAAAALAAHEPEESQRRLEEDGAPGPVVTGSPASSAGNGPSAADAGSPQVGDEVVDPTELVPLAPEELARGVDQDGPEPQQMPGGGEPVLDPTNPPSDSMPNTPYHLDSADGVQALPDTPRSTASTSASESRSTLSGFVQRKYMERISKYYFEQQQEEAAKKRAAEAKKMPTFKVNYSGLIFNNPAASEKKLRQLDVEGKSRKVSNKDQGTKRIRD